MIRLARFALPAALCLAWSTAPAQALLTVISGNVLDPEGKPLALAHVHLERSRYGAPVVQARVRAGGGFVVATADTGPVWLRFTAVDHSNVDLPLWLRPPAVLRLEVRLKRYAYNDVLDDVRAIGDWSGFDFSKSRPLVKQADGRYTLDVETTADTLAYQLLGLHDGRSINGTDPTPPARYVYDGGGDYRSVIPVEHGHATVVLDPARLDRRPGAARVAFRDTSSAAARLAGAYRLTAGWMSAYWGAGAGGAGDTSRYDWTAAIRELTRRLPRESDPLIRQFYLYTLLQVWNARGAVDTTLVRRALRDIPADAAVWALAWAGGPETYVLAAARLADSTLTQDAALHSPAVAREALPYLERMIAGQPDPAARETAMAAAIAYLRALGRDEEAQGYYRRFLTEYSGSWRVPVLKARYAPDRALRPGVRVPDFAFRSLDDTAVVYSRASLMGQPYLLTFWATWCDACTAQLPALHAAYDAWTGRGVRFLSVSFDESVAAVKAFQANRGTMPGLNAFAAEFPGTEQARQFEIRFLPRAALVGPDGIILATDDELMDERLLATLDRTLGGR